MHWFITAAMSLLAHPPSRSESKNIPQQKSRTSNKVLRRPPKPALLVPATNRRAYIYAWTIVDEAQNGVPASSTDFAVLEDALRTASVRNSIMCNGFLRESRRAATRGDLGLAAYLMDQLAKHLS